MVKICEYVSNDLIADIKFMLRHSDGHTRPSPSGPSTGTPHSPGDREYYDPLTNTFHW